MERLKFNPGEWADEDPKGVPTTPNNPEDLYLKVEEIIKRIEAAKVDIAPNYNEWRDVGFALANGLSDKGRTLYHRVSSFNADYDPQDCDSQYNHCLKSNGQGITIRTFFYLAKNAGIDISIAALSEPVQDDQMPVFDVYDNNRLTNFMKMVVAPAEMPAERDILLLAALTTISSCLPKVSGIYDGLRVFPNLYLFITAQASAGKGRVAHLRQLVDPVHKELIEQGRILRKQFEIEMGEYRKSKDENAEKPVRPPVKLLFIPANSSATGMFQLLFENEGRGMIFETEGDTLAQILKADYGNYSDGFRKSFHHENISYYRRTDREHCEIEFPCLSTVLTGTPSQISGLIPNAENGLFSRFMFYYMNLNLEWKDVFNTPSPGGLREYYKELGRKFYEFYFNLKHGSDLEFVLSLPQQHSFNNFFRSIQETYLGIYGTEYLASIRRLGLIAFRLAMIISTLRLMEENNPHNNLIQCKDEDLELVLSLIGVLVRHTSKVFSELPEEVRPQPRKSRKEKLLEALPNEFNRRKLLEVAKSLSLPDSTLTKFIGEFVKVGILIRDKQGEYRKKEGV